MGVDVQEFTVGVGRHHDAGATRRQVERGAQIFAETLVRKAAQILEQVAVETDTVPQLLGDTDSDMPVQHGKEKRIGQECAIEINILLVAGRAEPAPLAGERPPVANVCKLCFQLNSPSGESICAPPPNMPNGMSPLGIKANTLSISIP